MVEFSDAVSGADLGKGSAALGYAARGFAVFPCHHVRANGRCSCGDTQCGSAGKHPRYAPDIQHGLKDATTDEARIRVWWDRWPEANIGLRTGNGIAVLDIDPRNDGDGRIAELQAAYGVLPDTVTSLTGGNGTHYWFRITEPLGSLSGGQCGLGDGVDLKADGGYVLVPPSNHASGNCYTWDAGAHIDDVPFAPLPDWVRLLAAQRADRQPGSSKNGTSKHGIRLGDDYLIQGERNARLTSIAGSLRHEGKDESDIYAELVSINTLAVRPPLEDRELRSIARSVGSYPVPAVAPTPIRLTNDPETADSLFYRLYSAREMANREPPTWLVRDILTKTSLAALVGDKASLKSFISLDIACSVASGANWQNSQVEAGTVVYVLGEGVGGIGPRLRAWERFNGREAPERLLFLPEALLLGQDMRRPGENLDLTKFRATLDRLDDRPVLIILDTLARMMGAGNENDARDMGALVHAVDSLRLTFGATVLLVHHLSRMGNARGSTALGGALDTEIIAKRSGDVVTLECLKQKEFGEFETFGLRSNVVALGTTKSGDPMTSLALSRTDIAATGPTGTSARVLEVLHVVFGAEGASNTEWKAMCLQDGMSERSYYSAKRQLLEDEIVVKIGQRFVAAAR